MSQVPSSASPLPSFAKISECVKHLKSAGIGAKCILTDGSYDQNKIPVSFLQRGLSVTYHGYHGNRIIELQGFTDKVVEALKHDRATPSSATQFFSVVWAKGIAPGQTVFVQGQHRGLIRHIEGRIGAGNYMLEKAVDPVYGDGWNLTYLTPEAVAARNAERARQAAVKKEKALRYAAVCRLFGEGGIEIGETVTIVEKAGYIKFCLSRMFRRAFKDQEFEFNPPAVDNGKTMAYTMTRVK